MPPATALLERAPIGSPWPLATSVERQRRRRLLLIVLGAFLGVGAVFGPPTGREVLTAWVLLALWAACAGDTQVWRRTVARDWLPLFAVLFAYDLLRGLAHRIGGALFLLPSYRSSPLDPTQQARAHLTEPIAWDRMLFGGRVPTVWLQDHLHQVGQARWYDLLAIAVYFSHFVISLALAVVLWAVAYPLFRRYLAILVTLTTAALVTYVVYPAGPPWMASLNGLLPDGVARVIPDTLQVIGGHTVNSAIESGTAYANPVAALPSLHAAIPMMLLLFLWPLVGKRLRCLLVSYVGLMAFTLVYSGEHYVVDILAGWLYAALSAGLVRAVTWRRSDAKKIWVPQPPITG